MVILPDKRIVPVLMFHSVGVDGHASLPVYSEPLRVFEEKLECLVRHGFHTIFWEDLYDHMTGTRVLPENSLMLTFDDGYLDNWVYAYPLLEKYGLKATIFVSPDFVDPSSTPRRNLRDVWEGRCDCGSLQPVGFLNWPELRAMVNSGLVDIQSHALTHTWYFTGPRVVDFHRPNASPAYPWLSWNMRPERKPFYLNENQQDYVPFGFPVFEHQKSLAATRYFPDPHYVQRIVDHVQAEGGGDFFSKERWREALTAYAERSQGDCPSTSRIETPCERAARIRHELSASKEILEQKLGKAVNYICWPGGGHDESVKAIAREVGYKAWTLGSANGSSFRNRPGADPEHIKRIGTNNRIKIKGCGSAQGGAFYQLLRLRSHQGSWLCSQSAKIYKLLLVLKKGVGL